MFGRMLKRAAAYFLAFALIFGVGLQLAGSAMAAAGQAAPLMAAMDMGSGCDQPAPPCNGVTPDCVDAMGCLVNAAAPGASLAAPTPITWGAVSYSGQDAMSSGVSIKPEHSPPIPQA